MGNNIAVAVNKNDNIWHGHFGISPYFLIYDISGKLKDKRINPHGVGHSTQHHDNPKLIIDLLHDCKVFVGKRMGEKSKSKLVEKFGIETILTDERDVNLFVAKHLQKKAKESEG